MKRILLVDDDPVLLRIYQQGLKKHDLHVETATDGLSAVKALRNSPPDLAVLDLMMPKFTGIDVLKFIRSNAELASLPVVVLSNSFMNEFGHQAAVLGAQRILLKVNCSPTKLAEVVRDVFEGKPDPEDTLKYLAPFASNQPASPAKPAQAEAPAPPSPTQMLARQPDRVAEPGAELAAESDFRAKARRDLIEHSPATCAVLRKLCRAFTSAKTDTDRELRLEELYHKVHFLSAAASLGESYFLAQMASALEALLFELVAKPSFITPSVLRTIASTVDFLVLLFSRVQDPLANVRVSGKTLVVDDDPLSTRLIQAALARAGLEARATQDPIEGLHWVEEQPFALILLDIEMPGMNGFEFGMRVRGMPSYQKTPIIFVTSHNDFETRAKSPFHGGDDLIAKPVFPLELAVKAVAHMLRKQLPGPGA